MAHQSSLHSDCHGMDDLSCILLWFPQDPFVSGTTRNHNPSNSSTSNTSCWKQCMIFPFSHFPIVPIDFPWFPIDFPMIFIHQPHQLQVVTLRSLRVACCSIFRTAREMVQQAGSPQQGMEVAQGLAKDRGGSGATWQGDGGPSGDDFIDIFWE